MELRRKRSGEGFTLIELLVVITIIGILVLLLLPAVNAAIKTAKLNGCVNKESQLALGVKNFQATFNGKYPLASDPAGPAAKDINGRLWATPGKSGTATSGYSWIVSILPFMEEDTLYDEIKTASTNFSRNPFDTSVVDDAGNHFATRRLTAIQCPSYAGEKTSIATEFTGLPGITNTSAAISNYMCIPATHVLLIDGLLAPNKENGVIVGGAANGGRKLTTRDVADGESKTIIFCESREEKFAAWFDGQTTWVVCIQPADTAVILNGTTAPYNDNKIAYTGSTNGHALQYGNPLAATPVYYLPTGTGGWTGSGNRAYGPSSYHTGVVVHAFADRHVDRLSTDIDATVYMRLVTRNGKENVGEY